MVTTFKNYLIVARLTDMLIITVENYLMAARFRDMSDNYY